MSNINQEATFRGEVADRGVSTSKNGHFQLNLELKATECWDEESEKWVAWDYQECEAQAYLMMFSKDGKEFLNAKQAMKAFGWDGTSFSALQTDESLAGKIQFRTAFEEYNGNNILKVTWIDHYDADPHRTAKKLDASDLKSADAKLAAALKNLSGGPKPVSAKPKTPPKVVPKAPPKPAPPAPPTEAPMAEAVTKDTAWGEAYEKARRVKKTDVEIGQAWAEIVKGAGGDDAITDWAAVRNAVLNALGVR